MVDFGRMLRTGLSSLRDRAATHLAGSRFNPFRELLPTWAHEWEPFCISSVTEDGHGNVIGQTTRRGEICIHCGNTSIFKEFPCRRRRAIRAEETDADLMDALAAADYSHLPTMEDK